MEFLLDHPVSIAAVLLVVVLLAAVLKTEWILNLILRGILGIFAICFFNFVLGRYGIEAKVGVNPFSATACGFLGLPGLIALYSLQFYRLLHFPV